jgi:hypothetical protein
MWCARRDIESSKEVHLPDSDERRLIAESHTFVNGGLVRQGEGGAETELRWGQILGRSSIGEIHKVLYAVIGAGIFGKPSEQGTKFKDEQNGTFKRQ